MTKNKLEKMMEKEGWKLGFYTNWGIKYWSFRKDKFEISVEDITCLEAPDHESKNFKPWRKACRKDIG